MTSKKDSKLEEDENFQKENDENIEDLDKTIKKIHEEFRKGNGSASNFEYTPKEILNYYAEFN